MIATLERVTARTHVCEVLLSGGESVEALKASLMESDGKVDCRGFKVTKIDGFQFVQFKLIRRNK